MAESESGADKSEKPTEKRIRQSREEGEVTRSRELTTLVLTLAGSIGLLMFGGNIGTTLMGVMRGNLQLSREVAMDQGSMAALLLASGKAALLAVLPLLLMLAILAVLGSIGVGGWLFTLKGFAPKFGRLNPLSGVKRMFSLHSLVELLKALAKFVVTLLVAVAVLWKDKNDLLSIAHEALQPAIMHSFSVIGWSAVWLSCGLILVAAADVPFQIWSGMEKLKMTKQEVKDEYKDAEGKPEVKGKIRQMQRQMAQRRMLQAVPEADVVITNPTHFAVALKYDPKKGGAPLLLAKGGDFMALKIREIANENKVTVLESPGLARAVYYSTEVDHEIPAGLYLAVAQVLAYVYQLKQFRAGKGKRPVPLRDPPIPPDLRRDE